MTASALRGKTVLVTGAARDTGAAFAIVMADAGAHIIMTGRNADMLDTVAGTIEQRCGKRPDAHLLDLAEPDAVAEFGDRIAATYPKLDILINNAAQWLSGSMDDYDADAAVTTISSAATGSFLLVKKLLPSLEATGAGDILTIVSTSGIANTALQAGAIPFYMAKHAQTGLTNGLRQELAGKPIRVHAIYPPDLDTISPLQEERWSAERPGTAMVSTRDVVEAGIFALTRPRNVTMASMVLDSDHDGMFS